MIFGTIKYPSSLFGACFIILEESSKSWTAISSLSGVPPSIVLNVASIPETSISFKFSTKLIISPNSAFSFSFLESSISKLDSLDSFAI